MYACEHMYTYITHVSISMFVVVFTSQYTHTRSNKDVPLHIRFNEIYHSVTIHSISIKSLCGKKDVALLHVLGCSDGAVWLL